MSNIRRIGLAISIFILSVSVLLVTVSFCLNSFFDDAIDSLLFTTDFSNEVFRVIKVEKYQLKAIKKTPEFKRFIERYKNNLLKGTLEDKDLSTIIIEYIRDGKESIEKITGMTINMEEVEKLPDSPVTKYFNTQYNVFLTEYKSGNSGIGSKLKSLDIFFSSGFIIGCVVAAVISLILIMILQKSLFEWIKPVGYVLVGDGALATMVLLYFYLYVKNNIHKLDFSVTFDFTKSFYGLMIPLLVGLALVFIHKYVKKFMEKYEKDHRKNRFINY